jgi:alcohol dehydrogenase
MDAVTQLLEAYISRRATPITDALALDGLAAARDGLLTWHGAPDGPDAPAVRSWMAYAALLSGVCSPTPASASSMASPRRSGPTSPPTAPRAGPSSSPGRGQCPCLEARGADGPALAKLATAGRLLTRLPAASDHEARIALVAELRRWQANLGVPGLSSWGVGVADVDRLVAGSRGSSMRTNPIDLDDDEVAAVVRASL